MRKKNGVYVAIKTLVVINAVCALFLGGLSIYVAWGGVLKARRVETTPVPETSAVAREVWTLPEEYVLETLDIDGLVMEYIHKRDAKSDKIILQLHGGSYTRSLSDAGIYYRRTAARYAEISGGGVLTVDYRTAPEHPYPAALEDALGAYAWLLEQGFGPEDIIIAGDSAGGGLALAVAMYLRDNEQALPAGLIIMSVWANLDYAVITPPYVGDNDPADPYISPLYGDFSGFPPMLMQAGGSDMLLGDSVAVAQKAEAAGVDVKLTIYPDMVHVFQLFFEMKETDNAWTEAAAFIHTIFTGDKL